MKDELGERMKSQYEDRVRFSLPRRTFTIIRLDGKAFHTYTRGLNKPFDDALIEDMDKALFSILPHIQGAVLAYTQSDEISILLTDFATPQTDAWFDGNIQKIVSVSSSILTAEFNRLRMLRNRPLKCPLPDGIKETYLSEVPMAYFDSRVFTIPDRIEVMNYFIWRNQDCSRNSVSMVAQSLYSHKELHGKSCAEMQEMIFNKGINWNEYDPAKKNGRLVFKKEFILFDNQELAVPDLKKSMEEDGFTVFGGDPIRHRWVSMPAWKFTQDKEKLLEMIPDYA
jgi:tRNA(His) guanylyltransferase